MNRLSKLKKLRRMSYDEVLARMTDRFIVRRERKLVRSPSKSASEVPANATAECISKCAKLLPGSAQSQVEALRNCTPEWACKLEAQAARQAQAVLADKERILGVPVDLSGTIDWHVDPRTGQRWEKSFYADLSLYNPASGSDFKYPWELSRHQFLCTLARNYRLNHCLVSASRIRELLLDWINQNPVYQGINWTSALEVSMRSISWIWSLALIADWDGWRPGELDQVYASMEEHAVYLKDHFSYYSSPYNHLIGEAAGLFLLGEVLSLHPQRARWRGQAQETLIKHAPKQFYEDGFCVEQGVSYHFYTLGFLLLAYAASQRTGQPLVELEPTIRRGLSAAVPFRRPDGRWPAVGDLDSARSIPVQSDNFWNFDGLLDCGAVLVNDANLIQHEGEPNPEVFWLLGLQGIENWLAMRDRMSLVQAAASGEQASGGGRTTALSHDNIRLKRKVQAVLPDAGYVIASDGHDWMLFDSGPIAAGLFADSTPSTAHGHADTLQVLYFADGAPVLDDSGIPFYNGDADWIRYFRSPEAHNTVHIEGVEYVHFEGRLAWSREVNRPTLSADLSDDRWLCSGRVQWPQVTLERHVLGIPGAGLWIADWISTNRPREVSWFWQLPASCQPGTDAPNVFVWRNFDVRRASSAGTHQASMIHSHENSPPGLRCHGYGEKSPGAVLIQRQLVHGQVLVLTSVGRIGRPDVAVSAHGLEVGTLSSAPPHWQHGGCSWKMSN